MSDLRKAAEMALEALDCLPWQASPIAVEATKALRTALAQDALRKLAEIDHELGLFIDSPEQDLKRLRQVCRNVYEVWAGSEGIPLPQTAAEGYLLSLVLKMRDEAKEGLK